MVGDGRGTTASACPSEGNMTDNGLVTEARTDGYSLGVDLG
jgi:hypothetical protein